MQRLVDLENLLKELDNVKKELQKEGKIYHTKETQLEDLNTRIREAAIGFSKIGYLDKAAEMYDAASKAFAIAGSKSVGGFRQRALVRAEVYEEQARLEEVSIGLRPDLMVTAETVRLSVDARNAMERGIEWLKREHKTSTGGWGWFPEGIAGYLSEGLKRTLREDLSFTRAWDTSMAIRALSKTAKGKLDSSIISAGIGWLTKAINSDGGWGPFPQAYKTQCPDCPCSSNTHDTSCTIIALLDAGKKPQSQAILKAISLLMNSGRHWESLRGPVWCDHPGQDPSSDNPPTPNATSCALLALLKANKPQRFDALLLKQPHGFQNPSGGWGVLGRRSGTVESSYALMALAESNACENDVIQRGVKWLKRTQKEDGGWGRARPHSESEVEPCALAIIALLKFLSSKDKTLQNGVRWLVSKQDNDNWNADTSLSVIALHDFVSKTEQELNIGLIH